MTEHVGPAAAGDHLEPPETLEDFKNSFFYGSRSNLSVKFLASLGPTEAADAIEPKARKFPAVPANTEMVRGQAGPPDAPAGGSDTPRQPRDTP